MVRDQSMPPKRCCPSSRPAAPGSRRSSGACSRLGTARSAAARSAPARAPFRWNASSPVSASRRFRCTTRSLAPPLPWSDTIATAASVGAAATSRATAASSAR